MSTRGFPGSVFGDARDVGSDFDSISSAVNVVAAFVLVAMAVGATAAEKKGRARGWL